MNSLPFVPLEHYFYDVSSASHPLRCVVELEFQGVTDRDAIQTAAQQVARRHPLITARIRKHRRYGLETFSWHLDPEAALELDWEEMDHAKLFPPPSAGTDIRADDRFHLVVSTTSTRSRWMFSFPHARMDGVGFESVSHELMLFYAHALDPEQPLELPDVPVESLWIRKLPGDAASAGCCKWRRFGSRLSVALQTVRRRPVRLSGSAQLDPDFPADRQATSIAFRLAPDELTRYRQQGKLNDLLIRDLFLAIQCWREKRFLTRPKDWIRIAVPYDCRSRRDPALPACNAMSLIFMDQQHGDLEDARTLLSRISDQMQIIRREKYYTLFIRSLRCYPWLSALLKRWRIHPNRQAATACFSNLGRIYRKSALPRDAAGGKLRAGNLVLDKVLPWTPAFPYVDVCFCACEYAGTFRIQLRYDPQVLTLEDAEDLCTLFRQQINYNHSAGEAS